MAGDQTEILDDSVGTGDIGNDGGSPSLLDQAARCRRLAAGISDRHASSVLTSLADAYEQRAETTAQG